MKKNLKKRIIREIAIRLLLIINLVGGIYILGIIGSLENFIEVSFTQWVIFVLVLIFYFIEYQIMKEV